MVQSYFDCTFLLPNLLTASTHHINHKSAAYIPRSARGLGCALNGALARCVAAAGAERPCPRSPARWRSPPAPCFQRSVVRLGCPCGAGRAATPLLRWRLPFGRRPRYSLRPLTWSIVRCRRRRGARLPPVPPAALSLPSRYAGGSLQRLGFGAPSVLWALGESGSGL